MYNSQYYTCEQIDQRLLQGYLDDYNSENNTNLTKTQFLNLLATHLNSGLTTTNIVQESGNNENKIMSQAIVTQLLSNLQSNFNARDGYYQATINGGAITVNAPDYVLGTGGNLRIKMLSAGTTASTLTIGNASNVPLLYNGNTVSASNTWEAGEVISVYFDGTNYQASNAQGGGGGMFIIDETKGGELEIADDHKNVIVRFYGGHVKTKEFDSANALQEGNTYAPMDIVDDNGYVILRLIGGHVKTKEFDSKDVSIIKEQLQSNLYGKKLCIIGDSYVANHSQSYTLTWHYKIAQENEMAYVNYGINGNGLVASGSPTIGTPVIDRYSEMDDDADYVIVVGGKNDYNKQLAIASFKTGLASICAGLIDKYAARGSKIAFFTPWDDYDSGTDQSSIKLIEYVDAIIEVCGKYSIPVFDSSRKSSMFMFNETFRTNYCQSSTDISHLNSAGHNLFKNKAFNFLNQL